MPLVVQKYGGVSVAETARIKRVAERVPVTRRAGRDARRLDRLSYEEMLEPSASGAKVLMSRCVEYARRHGVPVHVRPSYSASSGTTVTGSVEDPTMEQPLITGIAHGRSAAKVEVIGVPDCPRVTEVFRVVAHTGHEIDMVTLHTSDAPRGRTDITMALPRDGARAVTAALRNRRAALGFAEVRCDERMGTVSLVGAGVRSDPSVAATFCEALASQGVGIEIISSSQLRLSVLCREQGVDDAVRALHAAFGLAERKDAVLAGSASPRVAEGLGVQR